MLSDAQRQYVRTVARTLQIIVGALAAGLLVFLAIAVFLVNRNAQADVSDPPVVTYAAIAMAILAVATWLVVPGLIVNRLRQSVINGSLANWGLVKNCPNAAELGDVAPLAAILQTRAIVSAALVEGPAFMACIAYMLEHRPIALYLAGALLALLFSQFPTVPRLEAWIEDELANIKQMRQLR